MKSRAIIIVVLILMPLVINLCVLPFMPAEIAIHYEAGGEITRLGSKFNTLIIPGLGAIFATVLFFASQLIDGEKKDGKAARSVLYLSAVSVAAIFNIATYAFLCVTLGGV